MVITLALKKRKRKKFPWKNNTGEERVNSSDSLGVGFRVYILGFRVFTVVLLEKFNERF
jgi:hypothetical protein